MWIRELRLQNFRNYESAHFTFSKSINQIAGPNGIGKSTLLEALYLLMTGRSFRTHRLHELIRHGEKYFSVEAIFTKSGVDQKLALHVTQESKTVLYHNTRYSTTSALLGLLPGVALTPEDQEIVQGAPEIRRKFLDLQLARLDPVYLHHHLRYAKALKHRNLLLKREGVKGITPFEKEMAKSASYITTQRESMLGALEVAIHPFFQSLTQQKESLNLSYRTLALGVGMDEKTRCYEKEYGRQRERELRFGTTLFGPHRDDFELRINEKNAKVFSSEGQKRSTLAALRLAEWHTVRDWTGEIPLFLIDDIRMSFDEARRSDILALTAHLGQVFITTTEPLALPGSHLTELQSQSAFCP